MHRITGLHQHVLMLVPALAMEMETVSTLGTKNLEPGNIFQSVYHPFLADCYQNIKHGWSGQLSGNYRPHTINDNTGFDFQFVGELAYHTFRFLQTEILELRILVSKGR